MFLSYFSSSAPEADLAKEFETPEEARVVGGGTSSDARQTRDGADGYHDSE
jgi:hypothetical protein